jgi:hypothetical protein
VTPGPRGGGDTGPTSNIWKRTNATTNVVAVVRVLLEKNYTL